MSSVLPELVDAWRMVSARRIFESRVRLNAMPRLATYLADAEGECDYTFEFGRDALGIAFLDVQASASLPLICQRTLNQFKLPVVINQRLGLIREEQEEASLPEGYEPFLVPAEGMIRLVDVVEDELILAVPVVPISGEEIPGGVVWSDSEDLGDFVEEETRPNPFAVLAGLKKPAE